MFYTGVVSTNDRERYRTKIQKEIKMQKSKALKKARTSSLEAKLKKAGNPLGISAARYTFLRVVIMVVVSINYVVVPVIEGEFTYTHLIIPALIYYITMTSYRYTPANLLINNLIESKKKKRVIELFTLFDMLKAELMTLNIEQQVNVYGVLKGMVDMFDHIDIPINKFLTHWKSDPRVAKEEFVSTIQEETAETIGNILYRLDRTNKEHALKLLDGESEVFSTDYYESHLQAMAKKKHYYFAFFALSTVLSFVWAFGLISGATSDSIF